MTIRKTEPSWFKKVGTALVPKSTTNLSGVGTIGCGAITSSGKIETTSTATDSIKTAGGIEWTGGRTWYVPLGASIATAITNATAGDTIVLASGTYATTTRITISKALNIVGQGVGKTIITLTTATAGLEIFNIAGADANNIRIADMTLNVLSSATTSVSTGIEINPGTNITLSGLVFENLIINVTCSDASTGYGILGTNSGFVVRDVVITITTTSSDGVGVHTVVNAQHQADTICNWYNVQSFVTSGGTNAYGYVVVESSSNKDNIVNLYNCKGYATGATNNYGIHVSGGADAIGYAENCVLNGITADLLQATSASLTALNCTLVNNTTSGTITYLGTNYVNKLNVGSTATDSIKTAGGVQTTIASDTDSDTDDVLTTTIANTNYGLVIVRESTGTEACVFLIAGGTIEKIGTDATFTVTKDNAATYNVYFETNVIKVQNKVGDNKNIAVGLYAI